MKSSSVLSAVLVVDASALAQPAVGLGVHCLNLVRALQRYPPLGGHRVLVPAGVIPSRLGLDEDLTFLVPRTWRTGHTLLDALITWQETARAARRNFSTALLHSPAMFWSVPRPRRAAVTLHDGIHRAWPGYLGRRGVRRWLFERAEKFAEGCEVVLTVSEFARGQLRDVVGIPDQLIRVVPNWISLEFRQEAAAADLPELRRRLGLPGRFWLYLGGFDVRKNVELLIRAYAAARVQATVPPLVLAGDIPTRNHGGVQCRVRETLAEVGLATPHVILPGRIAPADLGGLYRAAALLVYPSQMEGFGLPPAEAMAVGTPVLCADGSALPEVVRDPRCRFDADRPEVLRDLLISVARGGEERFRLPLPEEFTESVGIRRYLDALGLAR